MKSASERASERAREREREREEEEEGNELSRDLKVKKADSPSLLKVFFKRPPCSSESFFFFYFPVFNKFHKMQIKFLTLQFRVGFRQSADGIEKSERRASYFFGKEVRCVCYRGALGRDLT